MTTLHVEQPGGHLFALDHRTGVQSKVYLMVDLDNAVIATDCWAGAELPTYVRERRAMWFEVPCLVEAAANRLIAEAVPLAQRMVDGYRFLNEEGVGQLTDDGEAAARELGALVAEHAWTFEDEVASMPAADWFGEEDLPALAKRLGITADSTGDELRGIAAQQEATGAAGWPAGALVIVGLFEHLLSIREELRAREDGELAGLIVQIAKLEQQRNAAVRRRAAWGRSNRAIASATGITHPTVAARTPSRAVVDEVIGRVNAAGVRWFDNTVGQWVIDDGREPPLFLQQDGDGEVFRGGLGDRYGTGVYVHRFERSDLKRRSVELSGATLSGRGKTNMARFLRGRASQARPDSGQAR